MRLDFNVLWVEDQQNLVESTRESIQEYIRNEGFRLNVVFATSVAEAAKYLSDDIYGDHIDLVLMDYDLGAGGRGDDGLQEVRNVFQYKDIIFYSSQAPDLPKLVADRQLQGIFCSDRDFLPHTVQGVFDALMKKVLDIDHSRGIVMGATSDIDHHVSDCLEACFINGNDAERAGTLETIADHMKQKEKSFLKDIKGVSAVKDIASLQAYHGTYTSFDRLRLLNTNFERTGKHGHVVPELKKYLETTVPKRNDLAHIRVKVEGFSRKLYDRDGNELTIEQMKTLRQELLTFQELVEKLAADLGTLVK